MDHRVTSLFLKLCLDDKGRFGKNICSFQDNRLRFLFFTIWAAGQFQFEAGRERETCLRVCPPGGSSWGPSRTEWNFRGCLGLCVLSRDLRLRGDHFHAWRPLGADLIKTQSSVYAEMMVFTLGSIFGFPAMLNWSTLRRIRTLQFYSKYSYTWLF